MSGTDVLTTPSWRERLRANRGLLTVAVLVTLVAVLLALASSSRQRGLLDPAATDPAGSAALATLLEDQGVEVLRVTTARDASDALAAHADATLAVMPTAPLSTRMLDAVSASDSAYRVLVSPAPETLLGLAPWATESGVRGSTDEVAAGCAWDVALRAGPIPATGPTYSSDAPGVVRCWDGSVLVDGRQTVLGGAGALTNDKLDESGNAALALGALGRSRTLVWWLPSTADPLQFPAEQEVGVTDLIPSWVAWALAQVAVAVLVVVWWRARRLGRVVVEPLPVVVRATETVEGRARLYRRGAARGSAADALRSAALARLRTRLSLPRGSDPRTVAAAVASRTGRPPADVADLLVPGHDPLDDASLVRLAHALDTLENEVRHP